MFMRSFCSAAISTSSAAIFFCTAPNVWYAPGDIVNKYSGSVSRLTWSRTLKGLEYMPATNGSSVVEPGGIPVGDAARLIRQAQTRDFDGFSVFKFSIYSRQPIGVMLETFYGEAAVRRHGLPSAWYGLRFSCPEYAAFS